jgi:Fe-S cluster biogenesis protein NfuA
MRSSRSSASHSTRPTSGFIPSSTGPIWPLSRRLRAARGHVGPLARHNGGVTEAQIDLSDADRAERLSKLQGIIDLMRPAVQADGGDLVLVRADVESGVIEVQLQGACSSCAVSEATLSGGVERILRDRLPWVTEVVGGLDDSLSVDESSSLGSGGYVPSF